MRSAICFGDLKQAALYFDRALPVAFKLMRGTGEDIVFDFPEHIPSRALISLVFGDHDLSEPRRFELLGKVIHRWDDFRKAVTKYRTVSAQSSVEDDYEDLRSGYIQNATLEGSAPLREHFQAFAKSLGLECKDVLLPSTPREIGNQDDNEPILTLTRLNLIDTQSADWEQIIELRKDEAARSKLIRLRAFLSQNYTGKSATFIEDDLGRRLDEYDRIRRKFGFDTTTSAISILLDSKGIQAAVSAGIGAALFGGPLIGLTAAVAIEVGRVGLELAKRRRELVDWQANHELAYVIAPGSMTARSNLSLNTDALKRAG